MILHGSPVGCLVRIGPEKGRFGDKVFGTTDLQKTVRYMANPEDGGQSWQQWEGNRRMFVFGANPNKLLEAEGFIYILPEEGFKFDNHKGNRPWILSHIGGVEVIKMIRFPSVLDAWDVMGIYSVPDYLEEKVCGSDLEERKKAIETTIKTQRELLAGRERTAKKIVEDNLAEWMVNY